MKDAARAAIGKQPGGYGARYDYRAGRKEIPALFFLYGHASAWKKHSGYYIPALFNIPLQKELPLKKELPLAERTIPPG